MKIFSLKEQTNKMINQDIVGLLSTIEEKKGFTYALPKRKKLNRLHDLSKRRSVTSSNEIEGIMVDKKREEELLIYDADAETREDYALKGYNKALCFIMDNYKSISFNESLIKDLHYMMYQDINPEFGGKYKTIQNYINSYDEKGNLVEIVFTPTDPEDVPDQMGNLIWQFNDAANDYSVNKLILIFIFILDFLCIHPFPDGNGRISRLLTTLLLLKFGYTMDEYYSLSYLILEHRDDYYESLRLADRKWHENENDPYPFVHFHLLRLVEGYKKIEYIIEIADMKGQCSDKVLKVIKDYNKPASKAYIEEVLFEYSRTSIEKALGELVSSSEIRFIKKGRSAEYII